MIRILPGALSFLLFVLFDLRRARGKSGAALFIGGALLLLGSTVSLLYAAGAPGDLWRKLCLLPAFLGGAGLVYVLFFALPSKNVYLEKESPPLCSGGVYALCRHPGFWPFVLTALCLGLYAGSAQVWTGMLVFTLLNLLYIALQDRYLFPIYIDGYDEYRRTVPFLIPTWKTHSRR